MKGKKVLILLTLMLMGILTLASGGSFAAEQPGLTKEKALETARNMLKLPDNLENLEVGYEERDDAGEKGKFWSFHWYTDGTEGYSINVRLNALTGEIVNYSRYDNNSWEKRSLLPKISRSEGEKIARAFMKKLQPVKSGQVILNETYGQNDDAGGPVNYQFQYQRAVSGIPVLMNTISLSVDGDTGTVSDYHCFWDDQLKLPAADKIITTAQAEEIFQKEIGLEEKYFLPFDSGNKTKIPSLVYAVKKPYLWINALTGETVTMASGDYGSGGYMERFSQKTANEMGSAAGETDIRINEGELSKEEALAVVKKLVAVPDGFTLNSANYRRDWSKEDGRVWAFAFLMEPGKWDNTLQVSVDSKSGEIVEYSFNKSMAADVQPKYNQEKCRQAAEKILARLAGSKKDGLQYREDSSPILLMQTKETLPYQYHFAWVRQENGLPFENDRIDMDVNTITGEVQWYRMSWSGIALSPPTGGMLTLDDAYQVFFKEKAMQLAYTRQDSSENPGQGEVILVYRPVDTGDYNLISAADGKLVNLQGKTREESRTQVFTDIDGHWAAGDIQTLALKKVVSGDNGCFYPNREVTNAEFIKMLVILKNIYVDSGKVKLPPEIKEGTWYYPYVAAAYRDGIIKGDDSFQPNGKLSREYAAVLITRSMGYDQVAGIKGIYNIPVKDFDKVSAKHQGHVAIVYGLGIIRGVDGLYNPEDSLTKGETASILVRMANTK